MKHIPKEAFRMQIIALAPVIVNTFLVGCSVSWTANSLLFFQQGDQVTATPGERSLLASSTELGQLILAIPGGILVDKLGRKKVIIAAGFCHLKSWLLLSYTTSINLIVLARFFSGIAIALANSTTLITIGEIASPDIRAQLSSIVQIFFNSGMIFQSIMSILFSSYFIPSYCSLALSCVFFISLPWILETPYYLISVSKNSEARKNLERIRPGYTEEEIDFEFNGILTCITEEMKLKQQVNWIQFLKLKSIREPLITAVSIHYFEFALGATLIVSFCTVIIPENDFLPSKYYPFILLLAPFLLTLVTPIYVEKFPRRTLFLTGVALIFVLHLFLALTNYLFAELFINFCRWLFTFEIVLLSMIIWGSVEPMNSALKSEIFPQSVKGFGSSLCVVAQSIANIILYQLYTVVTIHLRQYYIFVILAANSVILYLFIYFRLPEARGRYLADLQTCSSETTPLKMQTSYGSSGGEGM